MRKLTLVAIGSACLLAAGAQADMTRTPTLNVAPCPSPPTIDGRLDDPCWRQAAVAGGFISLEGHWPSEQTAALVTFDDHHLYVAFRCYESTPDKIKATAAGRDQRAIFHDDDVELFLDIDHDQKTYYHFAINPHAAHYEAACDASGDVLNRNDAWNPSWQVACDIDGASWTAELQIPFASLGVSRPTPGTTWGVNFTRSRWIIHRSEHGSWARTRGYFNQPAMFGDMTFGTSNDVSLTVAACEGPPANRVSIELHNQTDRPIAVRTVLNVSTDGADAARQQVTTPLDAHQTRRLDLSYQLPGNVADDVPLTDPDVASLELAVTNDQNAAAYASTKGAIVTSLLNVSIDRYDYMPDARQLDVQLLCKTKAARRFDIAIGPQPGGPSIASAQIAVTDDREKYNASFDITDWPDGRYVMSVDLLGSNGQRLGSAHRVIFKRRDTPMAAPPGPVDGMRADGRLLAGGEPVFPFFTTETDVTSPLAQDCFNTRYGDFGLTAGALSRRKVGLPWATSREDRIFILMPPEEQMYRDIRRLVEAGRSDPSLLYWFLKYEAKIPMFRGESEMLRLDNVQVLADINRFVKSLDPAHLTCIQVEHGMGDRWQWPGDMTPYRDCADVIEVATRSSYARRLIPNFVADIHEIKRILRPGKPFVIMIGSSIPAAEYRTAEEIRCATFLALLHGAAGVIYHMGHEGVDPAYSRHWSVYRGLSRDVAQLLPIIDAPVASESQVAGDHPSIEWATRRHANATYLIAINTSDRLAHASFTWTDHAPSARHIDVLFENRSIDMHDDAFTDSFTAYEPHVYRLSPAEVTFVD